MKAKKRKKTERQKLLDEVRVELKEDRQEEVRKKLKSKLAEVEEAKRVLKRLERQLGALVEEDESE